MMACSLVEGNTVRWREDRQNYSHSDSDREYQRDASCDTRLLFHGLPDGQQIDRQ
jgi:hypothetical protein